jgi:hypothetical protein
VVTGGVTLAVEALKLSSAAAIGLFAGATLAEGCLLVPYWRSLAPAEFFAWYAANDRRLLRFFGPLTVAAALLALAAAAVACWTRDPGRWSAVVAAGFTIVTVLMFPVYFREANARFAAGIVPQEDLPAELVRWATWHWVRTVLVAAALVESLLAAR